MNFSTEFVRNTSVFSNQASTVYHSYSSSNNVLDKFVGVALLEENETRRQATRHLTPYSFVQTESTESTHDKVGSIRPRCFFSLSRHVTAIPSPRAVGEPQSINGRHPYSVSYFDC
jgi:hypothetical protein